MDDANDKHTGHVSEHEWRYRGRPRRIFLAEDDAEMRSLLAAALRRYGYEVVVAADGLDLLRQIDSTRLPDDPGSPCDAVITDIRMPGADGLTILARLRRDHADLPVVLITGFGDAATHDEARRLGAFAVFDKPFDVVDLRLALLNLRWAA